MGLKMSCPIQNCVKEEEPLLPFCYETLLFGNGTEESYNPNEPMETFGRRALYGDSEVVQWRTSPCWDVYERAFLCWFKSTAHWKGTDCYDYQMAVRNCVKANPEYHPEQAHDILEHDE